MSSYVAPPSQCAHTSLICIQFDGYAPSGFTRQLNVLLGGRQPTKRRLVQVTVLFMEYFMVNAYESRSTHGFLLTIFQKDCKKHGRPFPFKLEHCVLRRIDVVSRSCVRPIFDFVNFTD